MSLTLSPELTRDIYRILRDQGTPHKSVIVATGDGDVLAIADHDRQYHFNPNDHRRISRLEDSLYMYGALGSDISRRAFGNANLHHMKYGPGSSQKPLIWTSVASRLDYNWRQLNIEPYAQESEIVTNGGNNFSIKWFNGLHFKYKTFSPPR